MAPLGPLGLLDPVVPEALALPCLPLAQEVLADLEDPRDLAHPWDLGDLLGLAAPVDLGDLAALAPLVDLVVLLDPVVPEALALPCLPLAQEVLADLEDPRDLAHPWDLGDLVCPAALVCRDHPLAREACHFQGPVLSL